jgi:PD-(D/E)XK endonuclease
MARPRTWTDGQLVEAVAVSTTWNEVVHQLGRQKNTKARKTIQGHVTRLGLDVSHLPSFEPVAPIYPDQPFPAEGFADAVKQSSTWAEVMRRLGMRESKHNYGRLQRMASELELDASHFRGQAWASRPVTAMPTPFTREPYSTSFRKAATAIAMAWFLERGYGVCLPVEPRSYDLVVESDEGFMKVQVKSTTSRDNGRWCVRIHRKAYHAGAEAIERRMKRVYCADEVDFFFVVVKSGDKYVIPLSATRGMTQLTLDGKYAAYRVD